MVFIEQIHYSIFWQMSPNFIFLSQLRDFLKIKKSYPQTNQSRANIKRRWTILGDYNTI